MAVLRGSVARHRRAARREYWDQASPVSCQPSEGQSQADQQEASPDSRRQEATSPADAGSVGRVKQTKVAVGCFRAVEQMQANGQAAGGINQKADRLLQQVLQQLPLQPIARAWPAAARWRPV